MKNLFLEIANVKIKIITDFAEYYNFFYLFFEKLILPQDLKPEADIEINIFWHEKPLVNYLKALKREDRFSEIGANTLMKERRFATIRKIERKSKVVFDVEEADNKIKVKALFQRKPFKDFMRYSLFGKQRDEWFFSMTYYLLYYPLFWYLECYRQTHVLHASALTFREKGIVVCGLEGIGKTSLALMFLQEGNASFLSDNLIFYNNKKIYPCYELIRMHKKEDDYLWKNKFERVEKLSISKDLYRPKFELHKDGISPDILIFPEFGNKFIVEKISAHEAVNRAIILSYLPSELHNYFEYRNLYNLLKLQFIPWQSVYEVLKALLSKSCCYRVSMPKADGLRKNFEKLKDIICDG